MNKFFTKLKAQAEENPAGAIAAGGAAILGFAKLADALGSVPSKNAYAKKMKQSSKNRR